MTAAFVASATLLSPGEAFGQACCAGGAAVTPARLEPHEDWLVGIEARAARVVGSFGAGGHYASLPAGASELDFEQDLLAAVRVLGRGQLALQVPSVETRRAQAGIAEFGGGLGDVNLGARYDVAYAGWSSTWPGLGLLAGLTAPTGRPPDGAHNELATDATGIGALQATLGLALEQTYGPWFVGVDGLLAKRTGHRAKGQDETLGLRGTLTLAGAYTFDPAIALGASLTYGVEGNPVINGATEAGQGQRQTTFAIVGLVPFGDAWRLQASLFSDLVWNGFGENHPAQQGLLATILRTWS